MITVVNTLEKRKTNKIILRVLKKEWGGKNSEFCRMEKKKDHQHVVKMCDCTGADWWLSIKIFIQSAVSLLLHSNIFIQVIKWGTYSSVPALYSTTLYNLLIFELFFKKKKNL